MLVRGIAVLVRVAAGVLANQNGSFLKTGLVQNRHFWALVRVRALEGGPKRLILKGRASTESSLFGLGTDRALGRSNTAHL